MYIRMLVVVQKNGGRCAIERSWTCSRRVIGVRGVGTGGATGARAPPPIFCALALAAASHTRTTRNATGDLYLRRHNCPKCPQNAPKNCLKSQFYGGMPPDTPRMAALRPVLAPPVIFIFLRPWAYIITLVTGPSCGKLSDQACKNVFVLRMEASQLGGSGGMPPRKFSDFWCSEIDSGAI